MTSCHACGAELGPGGRFCHLCGTPQNKPQRSPASILPWAILGGALVLSLLVLVVRLPSAPSSQPASTPTGRPVAPDISQMTPREQADRLFDRVMMAAEQGDNAGVSQFAGKTVEAYRLLGALDADARYHLALLLELQGDPDAALAQADSIDQAVPGHLFATLVRHRVAQIAAEPAGLERVYREFVARYERQESSPQPEYEAHQRTIDAVLAEARRAIGGAR